MNKPRFLIFLTMVVGLLISSGAASAKDSAEYNGFLEYDGDFHQDIIVPQVKAWQKVASLIYPNISDDTATEWAALKIDSIASVVLDNPYMARGEQLAQIYRMECLAAYGMSYLSAIMISPINPEFSAGALAMVQRSDDLFEELQATDFKSLDKLLEYEYEANYDFCMLCYLLNLINDEDLTFVNQSVDVNDYCAEGSTIIIQQLKNEIQGFRSSYRLSNTAFFLTFYPLSAWLGGVDFVRKNEKRVMELANWFDSTALIQRSALSEDTIELIPEESTKEFSPIWKKSTDYRAEIILLLAQAIEEMSDGAESNIELMEVPDSNEIADFPDVAPQFPGGEKALMEWLAQNIRYPEAAQKNGAQGRVIVRFIVGKDGYISDEKVMKGVDKDLDSEAIRVIKSSPRWIPGMKDDKPVATHFTLPISFKLGVTEPEE